ncbi:RadC family protein [Pedobacter sp. AW1-32]|uniref:RadC family protein n=1 Tax=Pedobacter sp. AW1-32 TaxID=3383026 RepID=UPI003FEEDA75
MENYNHKLGIKLWAEEDRPREKLLLHGRRHLTDAELIAILIGSGNAQETAVDLSKRILASYGHNLFKLGTASIADLSKFKGIGEAKAISIVAALELGLRRREKDTETAFKITTARDGYDYMRNTLADLDHEEFWIILLNRANHVLGKHLISRGGQSGTVVDAKIIFKIALQHNAASLILTHNHPSGNVKPSDADNKITKNLVSVGQALNLFVADHIVFGLNDYYSYRDHDCI